MGKVYYMGFLSEPDNPNNFHKINGSNIKMLYILDVLKRFDLSLVVVSLGMSDNNSFFKKIVKDNVPFFYFATIKDKNFLSKYFLLLQIVLFLLFFVGKRDRLIFYHVKKILPFIFLIKKIKKFELVLEVEENYSAVWGEDSKSIDNENNEIKKADKFIFVNDIFPIKASIEKPYVVCYGDYRNKKYSDRGNLYNKNITMVYAGLISDDFYSDIYLAVHSMLYLKENYILKIIGYGKKKTIEKLKEYIVKKGLDNRVMYDGMFVGEGYSNYLKQCDIGLNPRVLCNSLSDYTFPSKVLTYLSHGLPVVSTDIDCIKFSEVAYGISFSKEILPESFAEAINQVKLDNNVAEILSELNSNFEKKLKGLLENDID